MKDARSSNSSALRPCPTVQTDRQCRLYALIHTLWPCRDPLAWPKVLTCSGFRESIETRVALIWNRQLFSIRRHFCKTIYLISYHGENRNKLPMYIEQFHFPLWRRDLFVTKTHIWIAMPAAVAQQTKGWRRSGGSCCLLFNDSCSYHHYT